MSLSFCLSWAEYFMFVRGLPMQCKLTMHKIVFKTNLGECSRYYIWCPLPNPSYGSIPELHRRRSKPALGLPLLLKGIRRYVSFHVFNILKFVLIRFKFFQNKWIYNYHLMPCSSFWQRRPHWPREPSARPWPSGDDGGRCDGGGAGVGGELWSCWSPLCVLGHPCFNHNPCKLLETLLKLFLYDLLSYLMFLDIQLLA